MSLYLAADLGAESGRVIAGRFDGERVSLEDVHRFPNVPVRTPDGLHWNILSLYREILTGLRMAGERFGPTFSGIGVESWGVDFGLLDSAGRLLGNPFHYRDARTDGMPAAAAALVSPAEQFARTGIAQMQINTVYQLLSMVRAGDRTLELADALLITPDLLHYWLTGNRVVERTNASTSGALGVDGRWDREMLSKLGIPTQMLIEPSPSGTRVGTLRGPLQQECGVGPVPVIAPSTHDTACAVVAVPAEPARSHVYISSGTWSLLGVELDEPNLSERARLAGFTNESGAAGKFRFLTNIMGLWLVQESRRAWSGRGTQETWSYEEMMARAAAIDSPSVLINVDDPAFLHPDDMPAAIRASLSAEEAERVTNPVAMVRAIFESLALAYRVTVEEIEGLIGREVSTIHIVGGGSRNVLLCQLTADAAGREVVAGPSEATALGNVLIQAMGAGELAGLEQARAVARASAQVRRFQPRGNRADWADRHGRLVELRARARIAGAAAE